MKTRSIFDYSRLKLYCDENNIKLLNNYENVKVTRNTTIEAKCAGLNCYTDVKKTFRRFINNGGCYCNKCTQENAINKHKKTCLEKYGVEYIFQDKNVLEKRKKTYLLNLGVESPLQNKEIMNKIKETCLNKYGYEHPSQSKEISEKKRNTCLEKYGVEYVLQNKDVIKKRKETLYKRYGVEHAMQNTDFINKNKKTCLEKYGVENVLQNKDVIQKIKETCLEKYGVEHPLQNSEIARKAFKNAYNQKPFIFPSGVEIMCQGYEPFALDELIQTTDETDIITGCNNVPRLTYIDENGKKHYHFVDIFIKSQNKCIEIKSLWTLNIKKDNVLLKQKFAKEQGYEYEIWVFNSKGEKIQCIK